MSVTLGPSLTIRDMVVAALYNQEITPHPSRRGISMSVSKRPIAILIRHNEHIEVFSLDGTSNSIEKIEHDHPEAFSRFMSVNH